MFSEPDSLSWGRGWNPDLLCEGTGQEEQSDWEDVSSKPTRAEAHPHPIVGHFETATLD